MDERHPDEPPDESLKSLLDRWVLGTPSDALEAHLRRSFRSKARAKRHRPWRRWLGESVRVPVPLLLALVTACIVSTILAVGGRASRSTGTVERALPKTLPDPATRTASLVGFEPVPKPKLTVLPRVEGP